jgi:hypothetical protein
MFPCSHTSLDIFKSAGKWSGTLGNGYAKSVRNISQAVADVNFQLRDIGKSKLLLLYQFAKIKGSSR